MTFAGLWPSLYAQQTASTGFVYTATVGAVADKRVISTDLNFDTSKVDGGTGQSGEFEMQMLESDFPSDPAQFTDEITIKRDATAVSSGLKVMSFRKNNGVMYIQAGDPTTNP